MKMQKFQDKQTVSCEKLNSPEKLSEQSQAVVLFPLLINVEF